MDLNVYPYFALQYSIMEKKVNRFGVKSQKICLLLVFSFFSFTALFAQGSPSFQLKANVTESHCEGNGHVIAVKVEGGQSPYTFNWNDGAEGRFRKNLKSGTYTCTVKDAKGVEQSKTFSFAPQPAALHLDVDQQKADDATYHVSLNAKGGKAPYTYFWIGPGLDPKNPANKSSMANLSRGTYQVVVQDVNGCTANNTITLK